MEEKITELYRDLYEQNIELFEFKKTDIKKSKSKNFLYAFKAFFLRYILILLIFACFFILTLFLLLTSSLYAFPAILASTVILLLIAPRRKYFFIFNDDKLQPYYMIGIDNESEDEYMHIIYYQICRPIILNVIPNIQYEHSKGISKELYESMGFSNNHSLYYSTDNITLNKENILISKVHTKFYEKSSNAIRSYTSPDLYYETLFCGIVSINTLNYSIPFKIKIRNKSLQSLKLKNKIKTNNAEFNKYYELETDNIDLFKKYFNDSILNYFVKLAKDKQNLEVNIYKNHIFIRLHDKNFLEFNIRNKNTEKIIISSCKSINTIIDINHFLDNEFKSIF